MGQAICDRCQENSLIVAAFEDWTFCEECNAEYETERAEMQILIDNTKE